MKSLFWAETRRFRGWAIAFAAAHLMVLGFLTRLVDLAQQPRTVYLVFGCVYALTGLLLGLYQMGGYRRPNAWVSLLHRPLPHRRVAGALLAAGAALLLVTVLVPLLATLLWQETMTARVVDRRHLLLVLSAQLVALCGYLAGGCTMLGSRRHAPAALVFLLLLYFSQATGLGAIALQALTLAWLAAMMLFAFKPDLQTPPRTAMGIVATAAPLQMGLWFVLLLAGFAGELVWILQGSHPNNLPKPVPGSTKEADNAEGRELMVLGLAASSAAEAPLWREQAAISDLFRIGPSLDELPRRHELTNLAPMEFDDETRNVRWVFSHDSMRFEGYSLANDRAVGALGLDGDGTFPSPPLPGPEGALLGGGTVYQYVSEARLVLPRAELPDGEVVTGFERIGERIALLSDRALYIYDGRELLAGDGLLAPRQRVPLPGKSGNLTRVDLMELLDGYLASFTFTRGVHNGEGTPFQEIVRVDGLDRVTPVARRTLTHAGGSIYLYSSWYPSPVLYAVQKAATCLFAGPAPARAVQRPPVPFDARVLAGALLLLSGVGAAGYLRRARLPDRARWAWIVTCAVVGVPALLSLWLLYPEGGRQAAPALARRAIA
jgi:hypothetical protein